MFKFKSKKILIMMCFIILLILFYRYKFFYSAIKINNIRGTDTVLIIKLDDMSSIYVDTKDIIGDMNNLDDLLILEIPLNVYNKSDFIRKYELTFYVNERKRFITYLAEISRDKVEDKNVFMGYDKDNEFDTGRKYFYCISDKFYAMEVDGKYYSLSENQSKLLTSMLLNLN